MGLHIWPLLFLCHQRWTVFCQTHEGEQLHQYDGSLSEEVWEKTDCRSRHCSYHDRNCLDSPINDFLRYTQSHLIIIIIYLFIYLIFFFIQYFVFLCYRSIHECSSGSALQCLCVDLRCGGHHLHCPRRAVLSRLHWRYPDIAGALELGEFKRTDGAAQEVFAFVLTDFSLWCLVAVRPLRSDEPRSHCHHCDGVQPHGATLLARPPRVWWCGEVDWLFPGDGKMTNSLLDWFKLKHWWLKKKKALSSGSGLFHSQWDPWLFRTSIKGRCRPAPRPQPEWSAS